MQIKTAGFNQIPSIMAVIDQARQIMRKTGNHNQWSNGYPSTDILMNDIQNNEAFVVLIEDKIEGYFCFSTRIEPNYNFIENGQWLNDAPYGVIHRLASSGKFKGIAQFCLDWAFAKIDHIRVDTHTDNLPMQNFMKKNGFKRCGTIYVSDGSARDAFQKSI